MKQAIITQAIFVVALISCIFSTNYSMQDSTRPSIDPLIDAIFAHNLAEVCRLVDSGHSVCDATLHRFLPLQVAIMQDQEGIFDFLVYCRDMNINAVNIYGNTALHTAARLLKTKYVTKLLDLRRMRLNINICNKKGNNPLHIVLMQRGKAAWVFPIVKSLVAAGIDVEAKNGFGRTALHLAAYLNYHKIFECLLNTKLRSQMEARDNRGFTVLMIAADLGKEVAIKILLEHDASVSCVDNENNTSLMLALGDETCIDPLINFKRWQILRHLLNRLYLQNDMHTINTINRRYKTVYDIAMDLRNQAAVDLLNLFGGASLQSIISLNAIRQQAEQSQTVRKYLNALLFRLLLDANVNAARNMVRSVQQNIFAPAPNPAVNMQFARPIQAAQQVVHVVNGDRPSMPIIVPTPHRTVFPTVSRST